MGIFKVKGLVILISLFLALPGFTSLAVDGPYDLEGVAPDQDLINFALDKLNLTKDALKLDFPPGYMATRAPLPGQIPYKLDFFMDLYKNPHMVYPFSKVMERAVSKFLNPEYQEKDALYKLLFYLGIDKLRPGLFRGYYSHEGATAQVLEGKPLLAAFDRLYSKDGGKEKKYLVAERDSYVNSRKRAESEIEKLPEKLRKPLAEYLLHLTHVHDWQRKAVRNIPEEDLQEVYRIRDFGRTQPNGQKFYPSVEDVQESLDGSALFTSSQQVTYATNIFANKVNKLSKEVLEFSEVNIKTPIGRVVIAGTKDHLHNYSDLLLMVDLGGNDRYKGLVGANPGPGIPISVCIDVSGNDSYENSKKTVATQGAGILGTGILMDFAGNDSYNSYSYSQGVGFFGTGILYDGEGNDNYSSTYSSQGTGYFGIGLTLDRTGDDRFYLGGMGQGYGGPGGVGALANYSGDDIYEAERYASEKVTLADYHADDFINGNMAQGVGGGRRGDLTDGKAWSGGLGVIMDIKGDDKYTSGNWSMGAGYWFGTGIAFDKQGDDVFNSVYFTQGSEAHWAIGALIDESGNDSHNVFDKELYFDKDKHGVKGGAALGFGWDGGAGILIDRKGNDSYRSQIISFGLADIRSRGFFFDEAGDDKYIYGEGQSGFGASDNREIYTEPTLGNSYHLSKYSNNLGLFIDSNGSDSYKDWNFREDFDATKASSRFAENSYWFTPSLEEAIKGDNFGFGMDVEGGVFEIHNFWEVG
ncbi:hypothetical protein KGY79_12905 [Candidatus Bipolaricaulota bacterium]|nr:hypothetical protein [Candidatus Bipolaricaulota bacterium]